MIEIKREGKGLRYLVIASEECGMAFHRKVGRRDTPKDARACGGRSLWGGCGRKRKRR